MEHHLSVSSWAFRKCDKATLECTYKKVSAYARKYMRARLKMSGTDARRQSCRHPEKYKLDIMLKESHKEGRSDASRRARLQKICDMVATLTESRRRNARASKRGKRGNGK